MGRESNHHYLKQSQDHSLFKRTLDQVFWCSDTLFRVFRGA